MSAPRKVPIPLRARFEHFRLSLGPAVIFFVALGALLVLWRDYGGASSMVAQAEPLQANVNSYKAGVIAALDVTRFQKVRAGDVLGQVLIADPKVLQSSLAVIQADIEVLRSGMEPLTLHQRRAMDYAQLRLDWMRQRAQLAMTKVNLQLAQAEFKRADELFTAKVGSQRQLDQARSDLERLRSQERELTALVEEQSRLFEDLQLSNSVDVAKITTDPLRAAIAAEESKLRLTEAELSPIVLRAPVEGMVTMIYRRSGEAVAAGEPILVIAAESSSRIVGYLRPPVTSEPKLGSRVEIRTRNHPRTTAISRVVEVGTQYEMVAPALQSSLRIATTDFGLPVGISMPPELRIRPGELVDVNFLSD